MQSRRKLWLITITVLAAGACGVGNTEVGGGSGGNGPDAAGGGPGNPGGQDNEFVDGAPTGACEGP